MKNKIINYLKNNKFVILLDEFIPIKWLGIFLLIPTIVFILDIYIDYGWIATYYIIFTLLVGIGFYKFLKRKKENYEKN